MYFELLIPKALAHEAGIFNLTACRKEYQALQQYAIVYKNVHDMKAYSSQNHGPKQKKNHRVLTRGTPLQNDNVASPACTSRHWRPAELCTYSQLSKHVHMPTYVLHMLRELFSVFKDICNP